LARSSNLKSIRTDYYKTIEQKTRNVSPLVLENMSPAGGYADLQKLRQKDSTGAQSLMKSNMKNEKASLRFVKGDDASKPYGMLAYYNEKKQISNNPKRERQNKFNPEFDREL
jgi:hypothetical protein